MYFYKTQHIPNIFINHPPSIPLPQPQYLDIFLTTLMKKLA